MKDAATSKGYDKATQTPQTKTSAPTVRPVCKQHGAQEGCKRNTKGQAQGGSGSHVTHAFLRTSFTSKLAITETVQDCRNMEKLERDFKKSLSQLADHYGIQPKPILSDEFPHNIALALSDVKEQLKAKKIDWQEIRLMHHRGSTFFAKEKCYDTGRTLYYIPVKSLHQMLNNTELKETALLLVSVCTYLYKIADIPYYRQESSYMCYMYDMLLQLHEEEGEADPEFLKEFDEAKKIGDIIESELLRTENLTCFEERLKNFSTKDKFSEQCWQVSKKTFDLYREFPQMRLDNKFKSIDPYEDDGDSYVVTLEKYISFYASGSGWLADMLLELINNDLQELGPVEEPVIYQPLDNRKIANNNFDFEQRIFTIIDELTTILYEYERLNP